MSLITIDVTEATARNVIDNMETELESMENVFNSFRSNGLDDTEAYMQLQREYDELKSVKKDVEKQLDEQTEAETTDEGLGELFG